MSSADERADDSSDEKQIGDISRIRRSGKIIATVSATIASNFVKAA